MGNRAVIAFESMPEIGIYLHWNGGPESVLAFLDEACERYGQMEDPQAALPRLILVITEFFTHENASEPPRHEMLNVFVGPLAKLDCDNRNNGLYWIDKGWRIVKREHSTDHRETCADDLSTTGHEGYLSQRTHYDWIRTRLAELRERTMQPEQHSDVVA